ncbi:MAG TPA: cysteine desulfurase [Myxococcales bacterium]|nr:cysteine desulfurase [Myxococcales bacterium]
MRDVRADFPLLFQKPLVYLDNAATSQKPRVVIQAMQAFYEQSNANAHRGVYRLAEAASAVLEGAREAVRRFVNAASADEIVFTRGTTESVNLVAQGWAARRLGPGDELVVTELEHHSNYLPWQRVAQQTGATLRVLPIDATGALAAFELGPRTKLLAFSHVSNVLGTVQPASRLIQAARAVGAVVLIDAAQSAPHMPLDVQQLDCDFLAFSSHKMLGPLGIGVLYGKRERLEETEPLLLGGGMVHDVGSSTWKAPPQKFEAGTQPIAEAAGLKAAIEYLESIGMPEVHAHARELAAYATQRLVQVPGVRVHAPAQEREAVVSFQLDGVHPHDLAAFLDQRNICVRAGHHCAQPLMRKLGVSGTVRASVQVYNTREELDLLAAALTDARTAL